MEREHEYFQVFPLVVPADKTTTITIRGLYEHSRFEHDAEYEVTYYPKEYWTDDYKQKKLVVKAKEIAW